MTTIAAAQQPGMTFAADDYFPIEQIQLMSGEAWKLFGDGEFCHDAT